MAEEADESIWKPLYIEWEDSPEGRKGFGRKNDEGGDGRKQYEAGTTKEGRPPVLRNGRSELGIGWEGEVARASGGVDEPLPRASVDSAGTVWKQPENGGEQGQVQA